MRGLLFLLIGMATAPLVALVVALHIDGYYERFADSEAANLVVGRAIALAFGEYVRDVTRQEAAIGSALTGPQAPRAEEATKYLAANVALLQAISGCHWTNPRGEVVASSDARGLGLKVGGTPWFQAALGGANMAVSDLLEDPATGRLTFVIARGTRDEKGVLAGVAFAVIDASMLGLLSLNVEQETGGTFSLFDRQGTVVYTNPEITLSLEERRWLDKDPMIGVALAGRETSGTFIFPPTGEKRIGGRVPLREFGWIVGTSRPITDVSAPLFHTLLIDLGVMGAVVAGSALLSGLIARRITRPAGRLREEALAIGAGNLDRRVDVRGVTELAELGDAFNHMAAGLKAAREDREKAQAALQEVNAHLEQRTAELETSNRQLQEEIAERKRVAEDLARSNKDLEQFAYVASHDLQEPLRIVSGYLQLIERRYKGKLAAEADEFIHFAVDGAARMQSLIQDLLAYSHVGTQGRRFGPTDCEKVFERAVGNLGRAVADSGATVTHDPLPTILADATQLVQVFQNLIGNAIKFHGAEPPRIHVAARSQDSQWLFSVRDNGIGVEPQYAERIFILFQRLHARDKYAGTGIGLSVCQRIIERHGGRIWVESKPGEGSTFHFTLSSQARSDNRGTGMG